MMSLYVKQFLTSEGRWADYTGWAWSLLPSDERRIIKRTSPADNVTDTNANKSDNNK